MFAAVTLVFCAIASTYATSAIAAQSHHLTPSDVKNDTVLFVRGFGLGLEAEFSKNLTECVDDENDVLADFALAYNYIRGGIDHISIHKLEQGLGELGKAIAAMKSTIVDCGVTEGVHDIERIAQKLQSGPIGWVEVIAKEVLNILSHRKELGHFLRDAIKKFDQQDFYLSGVSTGCFTAVLIEDNPADRKRRAHACLMIGK
eukprot:TRINITY_DN1778_c0_g1_i3.p2 TRINITY_DN1778_c0_g1~~TRINITY_DN1778_c0_g1_i3.p2  ORF type:complete len:215 (-),score=106.26 TRINITY_DN1778_c0_g1_i3:49-654(-)